MRRELIRGQVSLKFEETGLLVSSDAASMPWTGLIRSSLVWPDPVRGLSWSGSVQSDPVSGLILYLDCLMPSLSDWCVA